MKKTKLPTDVSRKIKETFKNQAEQIQVEEFLIKKSKGNLNVGKDQFVRSLLFLIHDDLDKMKDFEVINDPRDVIAQAHHSCNGAYDYFTEPFPE